MEILKKFVAYNAGLLAKIAGAGSAGRDEGGIYLRATTAAPSAASEHGWIGGNPSLPDPFEWPERDGRPYQFLCQINCASLPQFLWRGLGPRQGWLAVFVSHTGPLDVELMHATELGPERQNASAWRKNASALHMLDSRLDRFLSAPPKWHLHIVHPKDGEDCVPDRLRQRPAASGPFLVAAAENQPFDWITLELLLTEAIAEGERRAQDFARSATERAARLKPPPERLAAVLRDTLDTTDRLQELLRALETGPPYSSQTWLSHADLICRVKLLEDEYLLQSGHRFDDVAQRMQIELANNQGLFRSVTAPSPLFQPETAPGRAHADLIGLVADLERDLRADTRIPQRPAKTIGPNIADWKEYRENFPEDWRRYAERVLQIRAQFYAFWCLHALSIEAAIKGHPKAIPIPGTLDAAIGQQVRQRDWAQDQLDKIAAGDPLTESEIREARQKQRDAEQFAARLKDELLKLRARDPGAVFDPEDWLGPLTMIDESQENDILSPFWFVNYTTVRSEVAKQIHAIRSGALPSAARRSLEAQWGFDAEQATLQLGGTPRGWCEKFIAHMPGSVLLLQIPSNNLTHFLFGDVDDLVISMSGADLQHHRFSAVCVDVSN